MVIDPDGSLSSRWYDLQCGATLSQLDWGCTLMCLGAVADYLFSVRKRQYWERTARPSGSEHLWRMLEVGVQMGAGPPSRTCYMERAWERSAMYGT